MHIHALLDAVRQKHAGYRAEASAGRLAALARQDRGPARRFVARVIVAIGFVVVDAGRRLDANVEASDPRHLRIVS